MVPITQYYLTRATPDTDTVTVTIFDTGSYHSYQAYSDLALVTESTSNTFSCSLPPNTQIDILGLTSGEAGTNFSSSLTDNDGDKVALNLPSSYLGLTVNVYSDFGLGTINYDFVLDQIDTTGFPIIDPSIFPGCFATFDYSSFTSGEYEVFTSGEYIGFVAVDSEAGDYIRIIITPRLKNGLYNFAVADAASSHPPLVLQQVIQTTPDELTPVVQSYDPVADVLVINAQSEDAGLGYSYSVYSSTWGGNPSTVNFSSAFATSTLPTITLTDFRGSNDNSTVYIFIRETQDGIEEKNWNPIIFETINGDWTGNIPAAPTGLTASMIDSNQVSLTWAYSITAAIPDGFYIYSDEGTGTMNYSTPIGQVLFVNGCQFVAPGISSSTKFGVRAYKGNTIETNTATTTIAPLSGPAITEGCVVATWRDS